MRARKCPFLLCLPNSSLPLPVVTENAPTASTVYFHFTLPHLSFHYPFWHTRSASLTFPGPSTSFDTQNELEQAVALLCAYIYIDRAELGACIKL